MKERARKAVLRSVSTQYRRSSRNSGWKTASRSARVRGGGSVLIFFVKPELSPQLSERLRLD